MSGIAEVSPTSVLRSGSDLSRPSVERLRKRGIAVHIGHDPEILAIPRWSSPRPRSGATIPKGARSTALPVLPRGDARRAERPKNGGGRRHALQDTRPGIGRPRCSIRGDRPDCVPFGHHRNLLSNAASPRHMEASKPTSDGSFCARPDYRGRHQSIRTISTIRSVHAVKQASSFHRNLPLGNRVLCTTIRKFQRARKVVPRVLTYGSRPVGLCAANSAARRGATCRRGCATATGTSGRIARHRPPHSGAANAKRARRNRRRARAGWRKTLRPLRAVGGVRVVFTRVGEIGGDGDRDYRPLRSRSAQVLACARSRPKAGYRRVSRTASPPARLIATSSLLQRRRHGLRAPVYTAGEAQIAGGITPRGRRDARGGPVRPRDLRTRRVVVVVAGVGVRATTSSAWAGNHQVGFRLADASPRSSGKLHDSSQHAITCARGPGSDSEDSRPRLEGFRGRGRAADPQRRWPISSG